MSRRKADALNTNLGHRFVLVNDFNVYQRLLLIFVAVCDKVDFCPIHQIHQRQHAFTGITNFSYPSPFVPKNEKSLWRTFVPRERKFLELSFLGPFVPGERKFQGTFVPGTYCSRELSFPGRSFRSQERSFPYLRALVYNSSLGVVIVYDADLNC